MKQRMIDYYMDVARRTAQLSYAEKLKVGAILVKDDMIISHSWNGTPSGWDNVCEDKIRISSEEYNVSDYSTDTLFMVDRSWIVKEYPFVDEIGRYKLKTKPEVSHAEESAISKVASSHQSTKGAILFCTHSCCMSCATDIHRAKIKAFYYETDFKSTDGIEFLKKCNIPVYKV